MATRNWEVVRTAVCPRAGHKVALEAQVVYPPEYLGEQAPRVLAHRCSNGFDCMVTHDGGCRWSGVNPAYDPFEDSL